MGVAIPFSSSMLPISNPYALREGVPTVKLVVVTGEIKDKGTEGRVCIRVNFRLGEKVLEEGAPQARLRVTEVEKDEPAEERHTSEASLSRVCTSDTYLDSSGTKPPSRTGYILSARFELRRHSGLSSVTAGVGDREGEREDLGSGVLRGERADLLSMDFSTSLVRSFASFNFARI